MDSGPQAISMLRIFKHRLRLELVALHSAAVPDAADIDSTLERLCEAKIHYYKATFGLMVNDPNK